MCEYRNGLIICFPLSEDSGFIVWNPVLPPHRIEWHEDTQRLLEEIWPPVENERKEAK